MAGIGFRLNKYFSRDSFFNHFKGVLFSVIISSGPWLTTVLTIATISHFAQSQLTSNELSIFRAIICYTYASSLVLFGMVEMPLTRYFADKIYLKDTSNFKSVFFVILVFYALIGSILGSLFLSVSPFSALLKFSTLGLFLFVFTIWISMIFLSAAKHYIQIALSFIFGNFLAILLALILGHNMGLVGHVLGLALGQGLVAALLTAILFLEYEGKDFFSFDFLEHFKRYKILIFVGLFYYLGIWIDKILFWFSNYGKKVVGLYYTSLYYDTALFLAYLTVVPAMAVFLVHVETEFYIKYQIYFQTIEQRYNLRQIEESVNELSIGLQKTFKGLIKFQLFFTLVSWYFAPEMLRFFQLPMIHLPLFRYGVIAAFFQVLFLVTNILLLYFKAYGSVFTNYLFFFLTNFLFTLLTLYAEISYHGLGIVLASVLTFILSALQMNNRIKKVSLHTFMGHHMKNVS